MDMQEKESIYHGCSVRIENNPPSAEPRDAKTVTLGRIFLFFSHPCKILILPVKTAENPIWYARMPYNHHVLLGPSRISKSA